MSRYVPRRTSPLPAAPTAFVAVALLSAWGTPVGLMAQAAGGGGMTYEVYSFSDSEATGLDHVNLLTAPLAMTLPVGQSLSLGVYSAWAKGTVQGADGQQASVQGFTDTEVSVALSLGGDNAVLSGGFVLPTGESTQSLEEVVVAGIVAAELLPFAISTWGSGGSAGCDLALAFQAGEWGLGVSGVTGSRASTSPWPKRRSRTGRGTGSWLVWRSTAMWGRRAPCPSWLAISASRTTL